MNQAKIRPPKVGICLVNFHQPELTLDCLHSINKQVYQNINIYLHDNQTKGELTPKQRKVFHHLTYTTSTQNLSYTKANNLLIKKALEDKCDYILLLNNDTTIEPKLIEICIKVFRQNPQIGGLTSVITYYKPKNKIWYAGGILIEQLILTKHKLVNQSVTKLAKLPPIQSTDWITGCCFFIPSTTINKIGLLDENIFAYLEDVDYSIRIKKAEMELAIINQPLVSHHISSTIGKIGTNVFTDKKLKFQLKNSQYLIHKYDPHFTTIKTYLNKYTQLFFYLFQHRITLKQFINFYTNNHQQQ